ncbi:MAG: GntR family transcriptional regulator [Ktedonobacteraceae bacterium]|nr:GntR family transcriptional regulator [Ktedonobacteraceae bacterium]
MSVGSPNKHEQAYNVLRERILSGIYVPGYRLVIDTLARELGVSAVPVREAIRRLEAEGWVVYRPNAGAQVASLDIHQYEAEITTLAVLEGYATALTAPLLTHEHLLHVKEINRRMQHALEAADIPAFTSLNKEFHFFFYDRCPNEYIVDLLRQTWNRLEVRRHTDFSYIPQRAWASIEEHAQIIDLIEQQAPASEIEQLMREHKLHTLEAYRNSSRYQTHLTSRSVSNTA